VKRIPIVALAVVVVLASITTGVVIWLLSRHPGKGYPQISAYSHGHLIRVGPYRYCDVLNLNSCDLPQTEGELLVSSRDPVQLSVPAAIGHAPWRLLRFYRDTPDPVVEDFRPDTRLAVTIPTVDPHHGRLAGIGVYLPTLVVDSVGELRDVPHAEWSVRTVWS
jgi:hypothetical protein